MATPSIRPPFAWLGKHTSLVSLLVLLGLAAFFRFYELPTLPPGLDDKAATIGLQALNLVDHGQLPSLNATNGFAPLWTILQASAIKLLGHTELALRIWPALLGLLAVLTTWLWVRSWFGVRVGWLSAFLVAVTPWSVTLSRNASEAALFPLLVTLTLWLATRAWRSQRIQDYALLSLALAVSLFCGPMGWLLVLVMTGIGLTLWIRTKQLITFNRARAVGASVVLLGLAGFAYVVALSQDALKHLPQASNIVDNVGTLGTNLVRTLLMFNVHGDENYRHNLAGEPLLNIFVGLMLVAGLLVSISRLHQRRYRLLFCLLLLILPAIITSATVPNAGRAVAALPIVLTMAAIGISYMLELWYATFPINSAARATGQAAIIVLLLLTVFQGYTQYFRAWGASSEVYAAYNETAAELAHRLRDIQFKGRRYVVGTPDQQRVVAYLDHNQVEYRGLEPQAIAGLPVDPGPRQFLITTGSRDEAVKVLKVKFPGGILRPHYSDFNQAEIYYSYELSK